MNKQLAYLLFMLSAAAFKKIIYSKIHDKVKIAMCVLSLMLPCIHVMTLLTHDKHSLPRETMQKVFI
jgi:hypothetical protein